MGYSDGLTANVMRRGEDGLAYYAPAGRFGPLFLVPDDRAATRIRREWKALFIAMLASTPIVILAVGPGWFATAGWRLLLPAPLAGLLAVAYGFIVARGLPRASIGHEQLVALPAWMALAQAMGATDDKVGTGLINPHDADRGVNRIADAQPNALV